MASAPPRSERPVVLASAEEIAQRYTVGYGNEARAVIENSRVPFTAEQRFGASAILAAEAQAKSRDEELSKVTVPSFTSTGSVAAAQSTAASPNDATNTGPTTATQSTKQTQTAGTTSTPSTKTQPPGLEGVVNQDNRLETLGQRKTQVFDINSFRSEIINNDILPSHSYLVTFAPFRTGFPENAPLTDFVTNKRNTLLLRCENVVLPTPSLLEEENIRRYGYGPVEKVPYGVQFSDVSMTWIVDSNSEIIEFFHQWMNTIVMHDSPNSLMRGTTVRTGLDQYLPFEVGYKDGYANPIVRIYVYNRQQETVTEYEMYDVFPMNLQSINLSWADENQLQKLTVTFAYTNMQVKAPKKSKIAQANFYEEGRTSPLEERQQPENKGGRAAADKANSPLGEIVVSSVNASKPFSYESTPLTLNLGTPETLTLTTTIREI